MSIKVASWNAGRVLQALGRIGYDPVSAILDLVDNSASANATSIEIKLDNKREEHKEEHGRFKAVLESFSIVDNGCGMDDRGLDNALMLGSSAELYHEDTLAKFGMGLKSAASSLGRRLEVISRAEDDLNHIWKVVLDQDLIVEKRQYVYDLSSPTEADLTELDACTQGKSGTLVRITKLHRRSLPPTSEIIDGLKAKAGVIYFYYLKDIAENSKRFSLKISGHDVVPVDPLFVDEIDTDDADLNENTWDGLQPKWITKPQRIQVDDTGSQFAEVAMTQLPHPPSVGRTATTSQASCRDHYLIRAGNYGFYIYRNRRLISWADSLGFVRQDQDLYAFRGRLLINSDADDVLNIDVTKSRIQLSEIAQNQLKPRVQEALKKSIAAWNNAKQTTNQFLRQDPHDTANEELKRISRLQAEEDMHDEGVAPSEEKKELEARRKKAVNSKPTNTEEREQVHQTGQRVLYVDSLDNNQLWERAHDPTHGLIVRINKSHRFCRDILDAVRENSNLQKVMDVFFYSLARGEYDLVYKSEHDDDEIEKIMAEFRERAGGTLSDAIRRINLAYFLADV